MTCVLCGRESECRDHLFFNCVYSNWIRKEALRRMGQQYTCGNWSTEERALMRWAVGSTFRARVGRLVFNVSVYCLWQERNQRIFDRHIGRCLVC